MPEIVTVIQARTGSTRLPGKILLPVMGEPLLVHQVRRVQAARLAGKVVVATTTASEDDTVVALCRRHGFQWFRGHATDLLDRHYHAGQAFGAAQGVVKIPSDCPLIDPNVVDRVIAAFLAHPTAYDFVSNLHPPSYPDGNDVEVMSAQALETAWREARRPLEREHTTPYLWDRPARFRIGNVSWESGLDYSMSHRWTLDYEEDYRFIRTVYETLYPGNPRFGLNDILTLLEEQPEIGTINARYAGVNWYRDHLAELQTISATQTRLEPVTEGGD